MKLTKNDSELLVSLILLAAGFYFIYKSFQIDTRGNDFILSAASFPGMVSILFTFFTLILVIINIKNKGVLSFTRIWNSAKDLVKDKDFIKIFLTIIVIGALIFIAVPLFGLYISGGVFMFLVLWIFIKKLNFITSLLITLAFMAMIYLIFEKTFQIPMI